MPDDLRRTRSPRRCCAQAADELIAAGLDKETSAILTRGCARPTWPLPETARARLARRLPRAPRIPRRDAGLAFALFAATRSCRRERRCLGSGRPAALAPPRLPQALVGGDDQPVRVAGRDLALAASSRSSCSTPARSRSPCSGRSSSCRSSSSRCPRASGSTGCRRRPILIAGDFGRAALLATIPLAYVADALTIWQLYVVGFLAGICTVFFDVAYQSYLPSLVERDQIIDGNSKLEISRSAAQLGGPGLARRARRAPHRARTRSSSTRSASSARGSSSSASGSRRRAPGARDGRRPQVEPLDGAEGRAALRARQPEPARAGRLHGDVELLLEPRVLDPPRLRWSASSASRRG